MRLFAVRSKNLVALKKPSIIMTGCFPRLILLPITFKMLPDRY